MKTKKKQTQDTKRKRNTNQGGKTTHDKFYPYSGKAAYMRVRVAGKAAEIVREIPETERSRFFTEAITNEDTKRKRG